MSGGHYAYDSLKLARLAEAIDDDIQNMQTPGKDQFGFDRQVLEPEAVAIMTECVAALRKLGTFAKAIEWFMSGDCDLDTLVEIHKEYLRGLK